METCEVETCENNRRARTWCGKHYQRWVKWGDPEYKSTFDKEDTDEERLLKKPYRLTTTGCWEWQGGRDSWGYGALKAQNGTQVGAHRLAHEVWIGPIPEGLQVNHHCDNPPCINPEHLYAGTPRENMQDRGVRLRQGSRKLLPQDVVKIRELLSETELTQRAIGERFNVSKETVAAIKAGRVWKHV